MTTDTAAGTALSLYLVGLAGTFGLRAWAHRRRTGSSGFNGFTGAPGTPGWWAGVLFLAALLLGAAGPALAATGLVVPPTGVPTGTAWAGVGLAVLGFAGVVAAQSGMGSSWRIGVDASERTDLVTTGPFAVARNPVFTAMCTALGGLVLVVPTAVSVSALVCLVLAVELQVRAVEEPYLVGTNGSAYTDYAGKVGRFVPGVGRLRAASAAGGH